MQETVFQHRDMTLKIFAFDEYVLDKFHGVDS
jgi:hypothetical protein